MGNLFFLKKKGMTYVVVVSVGHLLGVREALVGGATISDVISSTNGVGELRINILSAQYTHKKIKNPYFVQSGTTTDVTRADRGTTAETGSGNLIVENAAVVDL